MTIQTMDVWLVVTFAAALGCGLVAGVFFAFSAFVMPALARLPPAQGIAAMQSINVAAITPLFMVSLFGTAAVCVLLAARSWRSWEDAGAVYFMSGTLVYLIGTILVTIVFNVPRNNTLARLSATGADGGRVWAEYLREWTAWNHVRAAAALGAAALITMGLLASRGGAS